jgi:hypothetical protein
MSWKIAFVESCHEWEMVIRVSILYKTLPLVDEKCEYDTKLPLYCP